MNARTKDIAAEKVEKPTGLALMRIPFPANQISKLPKPTKQQTEEVKRDFKAGIRCEVCGQWHHPKVVHLDYVGHAALTDRLLDCDPEWNWEPVAVNEDGTPAFDRNGGMWIRLTVCGVTRLGYGHPDGKQGGDALKEVIGDALRNAAMRFGAALDLWHKGGALHSTDDADNGETVEDDDQKPARDPRKIADGLLGAIAKAVSADDLDGMNADGTKFAAAWDWLDMEHKPMSAEVKAAFDKRRGELITDGDEIPY